MKIVLIIPTYNEKGGITALLKDIFAELFLIPHHTFNILVVDANSPDGTAEAVRRLQKVNNNIEIIVEPKKRGLGAAYTVGIRYAIEKLAADAVIEFDGDFQHDPKDIKRLVAKFDEGYDYVIGSRYVPGGTIPAEWSWHQRFLSEHGSYFIRRALRVPTHDNTSGFKISRVKNFLDRIDLTEEKLLSRFHAYKITLLYEMLNLGARFAEVPITFHERNRGQSKSTARDVFESLKVVLILKFRKQSMSINPYRLFCRLLPILIAALTVIAFLPVLRNGFVEWDDPVAILQNPDYRGLGWAQLRWMFTTFEMAVYRPLTWITLGADYLVWGLNPAGYHLTSLFFHAANSILVYWIALQFYCLAVREDPKRRSLQVHVAAAFAALLFSLHPLTVEPVAWVSARSDLVAAFFVFISIVCYLRAHESAFRLRWLITAWLAYGFSILSKTTVMSFALVVVALDIYPLKRLGPGSKAKWFGTAAQRVWLEKLPFILLSVAAGLLSLAGKSGVISEARPWANVTQAAYALLFYPAKIAFPHDISPFYPVPSSADLSSWPIVAYPLFVTAITIAALLAGRRWPAVSIGWISYLVLVLPISGIVKYGPQLVADRYAYLSIAVFAIGLGFLPVTAWKKSSPSRISAMVAAIAAISTLALMTWKQTQIWHDSETLFRRGVAVAPRSVIAHHNLAAVFSADGRDEEAAAEYRRALEIRDYPDGHMALAELFARQNKLNEAIYHDRQAIQLDPSLLQPRQHLALILIRQQRYDEAVIEYAEALRIDPTFVEGHNNFGLLLARRGRIEDAIVHYRQAITLKPDFALAYANLGDALLRQGKTGEAIANFKRALQIDPNLASARHGLNEAFGAALSR